MKKLLLTFLLTLVAASICFAQSVKIAPKKVIYTRKGKQIPKEKRTFDVIYPVVSGSLTAQAKKNLENAISYWRVFETTLQENLGDYYWLSELSYKVNYNKNGVLDIALTQEGVGAYPDGQTVELLINLKTGEIVKFRDAFKSGALKNLAAMTDKKLSVEKAQIIKRIEKNEFGEESAEDKAANRKQVRDLKFTGEDFKEFSVNDRGATILYDAGFPHVIEALEPGGRYFFTWMQLKPFIRKDNILVKFIR